MSWLFQPLLAAAQQQSGPAAAEFDAADSLTLTSTAPALTTAITAAASSSLAVTSSAALTAPAGFLASSRMGLADALRDETGAIITDEGGNAIVDMDVSTYCTATLSNAPAEFNAADSLALTSSAALTTAITAAAASSVAVTASAGLTTAITLATGGASGLFIASGATLQASGGIDVDIFARLEAASTLAVTTDATLGSVSDTLLNAASSLSITGSAALTTAITAAASQSLTATGSAALTTAITPAAASGLTVTGSAGLTTAIRMAAAQSLTVTGSAALTTAITAAAASSLSVASSAGLTTAIALAGSALLTADTTAAFAGDPALLAATSSLTVTGSAALTTAITAAAASSLTATGSATLTTAITLAATPTASVTSSATLAGGVTELAATSYFYTVTGAVLQQDDDIDVVIFARLQAASSLGITQLATLINDTRLYAASAAALYSAAPLVTAIRMAAAQTATASATGSLTTGIALAAARSVSLTSAASLTTAITPATASALSASATGALTTAIRLAAASAVSVAGAADLATGSTMAATSALAATATGGLTTGIALAGSGAASLSGLVSLTTDSTLAAVGSASVAATGSITTAIQLAAEVTATVTGSVSLADTATLSALPTLAISATGSLTTGIALAADSTLAVDGVASIQTDVLLDARGLLRIGSAIPDSNRAYVRLHAHLDDTALAVGDGSLALVGASSFVTDPGAFGDRALRVPNGTSGATVAGAWPVYNRMCWEMRVKLSGSQPAGNRSTLLEWAVPGDNADSAWAIYLTGPNATTRDTLGFEYFVGATRHALEVPVTFDFDRFVPVAVVIDDNTVQLFVDGAGQVGGTVDGTVNASSAALRIGRGLDGRLDELRITEHRERYWNTYTPASRAFADGASVVTLGTVPVPLAVAGSLSITGSPALTTAISLAAAPTVTVVSAATLSTAVHLAAAHELTVTSSASLLVRRELSAEADVTLSSAADLTVGGATAATVAYLTVTSRATLGNVNVVPELPTGFTYFRVPAAPRVATMRRTAHPPLPRPDVPLAARSVLRVRGNLAVPVVLDSCACPDAGDTAVAASSALQVVSVASLTTPVALAAVGGVLVSSSGALTTAIHMSGTGGGELTSGGALTTAIHMSGTGGGEVSATGTLTDAPVDAYTAADVYYSVPMRHSTAVTAVGTLPNGQAHSVRQAGVSGTPTQDTAVSQFGSSRLFNAANQALLFDGISIEDTRIYGSAVARSYDVWFRPTSTPASPGTLWCVRDTQYGFNSAGQICLFLVYGADNKVAFYISNSDRTIGSSSGTFSSILSANTFAVGAFHHARVVFGTDGIIRLLVNGVEEGTVAMPATPAGGVATRNKLVIGSAGNVSVYSFPGRIEGFAILDGPSRPPVPPTGIIHEAFYEKWDTFSGASISNSDRTFTQSSPAAGAHAYGRGRIPRTGKWYCEIDVSDTVALLSGVGIATASGKTAAARSNGDSALISAGITAAAQTSYTAGRIMLAFDWTAKHMWVGRAGTWFASGDPAAGTNPYYSVLPAEDWYLYTHFGNDGNGNGAAIMCCASGNLNHAAPSGFSLLV